jgi:hypothetical protein
LEVGEDFEFQQQEWAAERIGWALISVIVALALLGLFGGGPLSRASTGSLDSMQVDYERFTRYLRPDELRIHLPPESIAGGEVQLSLNREYLDWFEIEDISPEPASTQIFSDEIIYTFEVAEPDMPVEIILNILPERIGRIDGQAGLVGGPEVAFSQLIYP